MLTKFVVIVLWASFSGEGNANLADNTDINRKNVVPSYAGAGGYPSHNHVVQLAPMSMCSAEPDPIMNAVTRCTPGTNNCRVQCNENFQLPNGERKATLICQNSEWVWDIAGKEHLDWSFKLACEPTCDPPCKNNGICLESGSCQCHENFIGPYCENEKKLCLSKPIQPHNTKMSCSSTSCTIACAKGHTFPDGSSITNMICKNGEWTPSRADQTFIPDCQPTCSPPCQNGGKCLSYNVCQCAKDYRGKQCQFNVEICSPKKIDFNGAYNCSGDNEALRCKLTCPEGVEFLSAPASEYVCQYEKGYFVPTTAPQCNFSADMEVIRGQEVSHFDSAINRTTIIGGKSGRKRRVKKIRKHGHKSHEADDDDDESYEKIITKTKVVIKKGRKTKKTKEQDSGEYEYVEYDDDTDAVDAMSAIGVQSLYISIDLKVKHRVPKPATCTTCNANKIKTFDGLIFTPNLHCKHTLVQDRVDGTFGIYLIACPSDSQEPCPHSLEIALSNNKYLLESINGTIVAAKIAPPMELSFYRVGLNYKIALGLIGINIYWDTQKLITIETTAGVFNRTAGLCGTLDQDPNNDFTSKDGTVHKTTSTFVDAWRVQSSCDNSVEKNAELELSCSDEMKSDAKKMCSKLLSNEQFSDCLATMKKEAILEACISDYCYCKNESRNECACNGLTVFAKECIFQGIELKPNWRNMDLCPVSCKNGRIYKACGPTYEKSCGSAAGNEVSTNSCNEGCFCPDGTIQHNDQCIRVEDCPCTLRWKSFKAGSEIKKDCNTCKCDKGAWACSDLTCGARCGAIGDDRFDFMGKCSYTLLQTNDGLEVTAENVACPGSISESMNFAPAGVDMPSCTKSVSIKVKHNNQTVTILLKQGRQIQVDGNEVTKMPLKIFDGFVRIRFASSTMLLVAFKDGLTVWWDGMTRVYIDAPATYRGKTKGLCGTFDSNQQNDFLTPEGDVESSVASFANKWRTKETCDYVNDDVNIPHPCQSNLENKQQALEVCAKLKSKVFEGCHWYVDPEPYYEDCMYDMCACKGDMAQTSFICGYFEFVIP